MQEIEFGVKLKKQREEKGMTQQSLADKLFVTRQAVSRWECGARYPDLMTAKKIAIELDTTIDELVSGEQCKRDIEKEQVLITPISLFIQTALYAIAMVPYLVMSLFCIREYYFQNIGFGDWFVVVISLLIKMLVMGAGMYYSIKGKLSPKHIGIIMSVPFFIDVISNINYFRISNLDSITLLAMLYMGIYIIAAFIIIGYFSMNKHFRVELVYSVTILYIFNIFLGIKYLITGGISFEGFYMSSVVRIFSEIAIIILLIYQTYTLNKKRKNIGKM